MHSEAPQSALPPGTSNASHAAAPVAATPAAVVAARPDPRQAQPDFRRPTLLQQAARWLAVAAALLGAWTCVDLVRIAGGATNVNPLLGAVCAGQRGCAGLLTSEHAVAVLGRAPDGEPALRAPWTLLGLGYFIAVLLWFALVGPATRGRVLTQIPIIALLALGLLISLILFQQMLSLGVCRGCALVHVINVLLVLLGLLTLPWRPTPGSLPRPAIAHALCGAAMLAAVLMGAVFLGATSTALGESVLYRRLVLDAEFIRWRYDRAPSVTIPPRAPADTTGSTAPAADLPGVRRIVVFSDFLCPHCRDLHAILDDISRAHPALFSLDLRHYPLDACNPAISAPRHPAACDAARAHEAVRKVSPQSAHEFARRIFENQMRVTPAALREWAVALNVPGDTFDAALREEATLALVRDDAATAARLGVTAPPAVFLDGRRVEGAFRKRTWELLLDLKPSGAESAGADGGEAPESVTRPSGEAGGAAATSEAIRP
ncbi:MAG: DsbA family protein [Phycisphaerales bacterium]|nr:DsbA family protein [Phycisphaerales bacterium]